MKSWQYPLIAQTHLFCEVPTKMPILSIITVTYNNVAGLQKTLASVREQDCQDIEHIIVDGASTDATASVLAACKTEIVISEPDRGLYDAMNKGIEKSSADWVFCLNAGDVFYSDKIISQIKDQLKDDWDLVYGNVAVQGSRNWTINTNHKVHQVHHQGLFYRKSLHQKHNKYIQVAGLSMADYLFFAQCKKDRWEKIDQVIAIIDDYGLSSTQAAKQKLIALNFILNRTGAINMIFQVSVYPIYRALKRFYFKINRLQK